VLGGILVFAQGNRGQQRPRPADAPKIEVTQWRPSLPQFVERERVHIREIPPLPPPVEWERIMREGDKIRLGNPNRSKERREYFLIPLAPVRNWQEPAPTPEEKERDIPAKSDLKPH
jgi:hypothetical protein